MARDAITPVALAFNDGKDVGTPVTINVTNGAYLAAGNHEKVVLVVSNTYAGAKKVTIKAGVYPPAWMTSLGDVDVSVGQNKTAYIVLETARFAQKDGAINVDFESGMTGTIAAVKLPVGF